MEQKQPQNDFLSDSFKSCQQQLATVSDTCIHAGFILFQLTRPPCYRGMFYLWMLMKSQTCKMLSSKKACVHFPEQWAQPSFCVISINKNVFPREIAAPKPPTQSCHTVAVATEPYNTYLIRFVSSPGTDESRARRGGNCRLWRRTFLTGPGGKNTPHIPQACFTSRTSHRYFF